jgi:hypothetical protein
MATPLTREQRDQNYQERLRIAQEGKKRNGVQEAIADQYDEAVNLVEKKVSECDQVKGENQALKQEHLERDERAVELLKALQEEEESNKRLEGKLNAILVRLKKLGS